MSHQREAVSEAIEFSRRLFRERHRFWAKPLVDLLENVHPKLSLKWAIRLFQESLPSRRKAGSESQQREWLDEVEFLIGHDDVGDTCSRKAHEVWCNDSSFNLFERAISRLFTALQLFTEGNIQDYRGTVITAAVMLVEGENVDDAWDEPTFEGAIDLFHRMVLENQVRSPR